MERKQVIAECRCAEIQSLKRDISRLEEIRNQQGTFSQYMNEAKMYLEDVARDSQKITESQKVVETGDLVRNLADQMERVNSDMVGRINNQISHMRSRLSDIQAEDERHHQEVREAEERRKQAEAQAKAKRDQEMYNRLNW